MKEFLPFLDLKEHRPSDAGKDLLSALAVTFLSVPQGVAYAMIAGLPPSAGLYATALPTIVGSMMRSSRHVATGPTNAISLLVGGGVALMTGTDPLTCAITLALMVGVLQIIAGILRLDAIVDYISNPVVLGYITGAGLLIGIGQLHNVTGTQGARGDVLNRLSVWIQGLDQLQWQAVAMAAATAAFILILRRIRKGLPGALIAMALATAASMAFNLQSHGLMTVADIEPIPKGLPPLTLPDLSLISSLLPLAVACTVLSLVESSAVARTTASRSGQRLNLSAEFTGQGLANVSAAFCGAYPTSASLSRSALNERSGAVTRLSGVYSGLMILAILLAFGHLANHTPIASLAGLLMVVAVDLVDTERIKRTLRSTLSDKLSFAVTALATWAMPLDQAIYLGVGISLILFLRNARLLIAREMVVSKTGRLREILPFTDPGENQRCTAIRIIHLEGRLFFGAAGELQNLLEEIYLQTDIKALVIRLKRTHGMDMTIAAALEAFAQRMDQQDRHLILSGVRPDTLQILKRIGATDRLQKDHIFATRPRWFASMHQALDYACTLTPNGDNTPIRLYLERYGDVSKPGDNQDTKQDNATA